ncbi:hypothetical protein J6524_01400 [Bradyrhizobium sp. WSM 1738]|uniref:hypothetical protein n=1 Tax=Bradyrhizobium hereditatis TaxID=2821405 RepID=UPI001CE2B58C|nr:hypothetical protein [Bradyrhizobium hereditatis]MCA6113587.1 hypothetical protein [Bradyrhizobium hereditatis]
MSIRRSTDSHVVATANVRFVSLSGKRIVKDWLALICTDMIRSLRTKWSRMENKAVVLLVSLLQVRFGWRYDQRAEQGANSWRRKRAS